MVRGGERVPIFWDLQCDVCEGNYGSEAIEIILSE